MKTVGLLAGIGQLPVDFLREAKRRGERVVTIAVVSDAEPALQEESDVFYSISVMKLNSILKKLKAEQVTDVTMLGKVTKEILFKKIFLPDLRALKLLKRLRDRKDDTIMLALVAELENEGMHVVDQTEYLRHLMPSAGVLTKRQPTEEEWQDIRFGFRLAKAMGGLDIGQTVVVAKQAAMAIEAIEGTNACIARGCDLARQGAVIVKTAKPDQDVRFDVPAVGMQTLDVMREHGGALLAIEAERTLFVDAAAVVEAADRQGICICAVAEEDCR